MVIYFSFAAPNFLTAANIVLMSKHVAQNAFLAIGMTFVIITGGIDLSVGSIVGLCAMVAGGLILHGVDLHNGYTLFFSIPEIMVIILLLGVLVGLINGLLITRLNVAPFIATLGTLYIARGAALLVSDGATFPNLEGNAAFGTTGYAFLGAGTILRSAGFNLAAHRRRLGGGLSGALDAARAAHLRGRRQRARGGSVGHPGQPRQAVRLHVLRLLRGHCRPDHLLGVAGGASGDRHNFRTQRHRRSRARRHLDVGRSRDDRRHHYSARSSSASCPTAS